MADTKYTCYQDGGQFYVDTIVHPDYDGSQPVADYGFMVDNDSDIAGARAARDQFLKVYGQFYQF